MTIINQITSFKISGFTYNGTDTQLNYTAGVASGTAQPSKALVLDAGSNINSINTMTLTNLNTTTLSINGTAITSGMLTNLTSLDGAIAGTGVANKVLILDSNRDINNIRNLNATTLTGTLQTASQPNITSIGTLSSLTLSGALSGVTTIGASGIVSITNTTTSTNTTTGALVVSGGIGIAGAVNIGNNLSVTGSLSMTGANRFITMHNSGLTNNQNVSFVLGRTAASNEQGEITFTYSTTVGSSILSLGHWGGIVLNVFSSGNVSIGNTSNQYKLDVNGSLNSTSLYLGGTQITATASELNYVDTTAGTAESSKAIILDSNRDIINIRNLTATNLTATNLTGTLQTSSQPNITSVGTLTSLTLSGALSGVTTISASGVVTLTNTSQSSSSTTGALRVSGGAGLNHVVIGSNRSLAHWSIYGPIFRTEAITLTDTFTSSGGDATSLAANTFDIPTFAASNTNVNASTGASNLYIRGPPSEGTNMTFSKSYALYINGNTYMGANKSIRNWDMGIQLSSNGGTITDVATTSNSTISTFGRTYEFNRSTFAASNTNITMTNAATVFIQNAPLNGTNMTITNAWSLYIASGRVRFNDTTTSTNTTTGALVVTGGVGIGGAAYIGGGLVVTGNIIGTVATNNQPNITTLSGVTSIGASNTTTITGILQTAAQTNITSVGTLTGLTSSGIVSITNTTASTSTTTGALVVSGGVGITGALNIGNTLSVSGNINTPLSIASTTKTIGGVYSVDGLIWNTIDDRLFGMRISAADTLALCWAGGGLYSDRILFSNNLTPVGGGSGTQFNTKVYINNTTTSTNTTSGALVIIGGIGIGGATNIGGALSVTGNITGTLATANQSNITSVGTLTGLTSSGVVSITNTTTSTNTTTGALVISGGLGIIGATNIGGALSVTGNITGTLATAAQTNITSVGTLTGLTSSGIVSITNTTASTNTTSGALVISGGIGIGGILNTANTISTTQNNGDGFVHNAVGTNTITLKSNINTANTWAQFGTSSNHELRFMTNSIARLNISNAGAISIPGAVTITNTTISTNTTTGALVISGGLGIIGATNIGGALSVTGNITGTLATAAQTNITSVGTLTGLTSSGIVSITNTTASTNTTSGALVISGGIGIGGILNTANTISTTQNNGDGFVHNAVGTNTITLKSNINTANTWAQFGTSSNHELRFMTNSISRLNISNAGAISIPGVVTITSSGAFTVNGVTTLNNVVIGGNRTLAAWGSTGPQFNTTANTFTDSSSAANSTYNSNIAINSFQQSTLAASNTNVTYGQLTTNVFIANGPTAGTNTTIRNRCSLVTGGPIVINPGSINISDWTSGSNIIHLRSGFTTSLVTDTGSSNIGGVVGVNAFNSVNFASNTAGRTMNRAATIYIINSPSTSGGNMTITNSHALYIANGNTTLADNTSSSSSTTGALVVTGGVGIGGAVNVGTYIKTPYIQVGTSTDTSRLISCLDDITTVDSNRYITLGSSNSTGNQGEITFNYQGSNSNINRLSLGFHSNNTILNILNSGNVGIGTINPADALEVIGDIRATDSFYVSSTTGTRPKFIANWPASNYWGIGPHDASTGTTYRIRIGVVNNSDGWEGSYPAIYAGTYNNSSDYRLKNTILPIENILSKLLQLNPVTYYLNQDKQKKEKQIGFLAHEVEQLFPEFVTGVKDDPNSTQSLNYAQMSAVLVKGIQEQQILISQLQNENKELKNKIINLENTLTNILERLSNLEN